MAHAGNRAGHGPAARDAGSTRCGPLALLRDPYGYISRQSSAQGSDVFAMRLPLRKGLCMTGSRAAELFYDRDRFVRAGAAPGWLRKTLFGQGGVQGVDGAVHRHRKQLFLSLLDPERIDRLGDMLTARWLDDARRWTAMPRLVLYDALRLLLTRAGCEWAGIPLASAETDRRARELTALYDGAAALGSRHVRSRLARLSTQRWLANLIERVRADELHPPDRSAAYAIAWHRDLNGTLLPPKVAAVELLNVIRPIVAVSVYLTFVAHALHRYPEWRQRVATGSDDDTALFLAEIRRHYPFFPAIIARVRDDFTWQGHRFRAGRRVVLDLHGTNHDARTWDDPEEFRPERFRSWQPDQFSFLPQGGGRPDVGHRCAGEPITAALMTVAADVLSRRIDYHVPEQDLRVDTARVPALVRSGFVIGDVSVRQ